ncbi:hypothetical protein CO651_13830 [Rhizobium phaseoli]|nr:hypothetical protein CO651_13830 [Rhizobium phaseoli]
MGFRGLSLPLCRVGPPLPCRASPPQVGTSASGQTFPPLYRFARLRRQLFGEPLAPSQSPHLWGDARQGEGATTVRHPRCFDFPLPTPCRGHNLQLDRRTSILLDEL